MEVKMEEGIKRIDIIFTNSAKNGFFFKLYNQVKCNYPMIEVKNISHDPGNVEIDQLAGRFNDNRGNFGILVCRKIEDKKKVIERCKTYLPNRYIVTLSENDLVELLEFSRESMFEEIDDFIDTKLKELIF